MHDALIEFPRNLAAYPDAGRALFDILRTRIELEPLNAFATAIFLLAVLHTFVASWFTGAARRVQQRHDARLTHAGHPTHPRPLAEVLRFFGEVEVVFGLWALPLLAAIVSAHGWTSAVNYGRHRQSGAPFCGGAMAHIDRRGVLSDDLVMTRAKSKRAKPKLPRAPLPRQTESTHEDKKKRPFRKEKHRKRWTEE